VRKEKRERKRGGGRRRKMNVEREEREGERTNLGVPKRGPTGITGRKIL